MSSFGTDVGVIALLVVGAAGLAMSLCGGVFTFAGLATKEMSGVLLIAVPSLGAGVALVWFAARMLLARAARPPES
jgi:hypothetical protein